MLLFHCKDSDTVFVIIWEIFLRDIPYNLVLLLNSVSWSRFESMYISLIIKIRSSLIHPLCFLAANPLLFWHQQNKSLASKAKLYFLYVKYLRRCLLHLIKQNCFLITYLGTLILMNQFSPNQLSLPELLKQDNIHVTPSLVKKVISIWYWFY